MIKTKEDLIYYLSEDKRALGIKRKRPRIGLDDIWKFEILMRKTEYFKNVCMNERRGLVKEFIYKIYLYKYKKLSMKLGFSIGLNVFGPGLYIAHYGTIVVNGNARVGKNCWIYPGSNIGANTEGPNDVPTIGDDVYIGPGAKIFGKIKIADNISIGANAVVTKSFETCGVTIAGVPARVIKDSNANQYVMDKKKAGENFF